jgi:hypothetical protein
MPVGRGVRRVYYFRGLRFSDKLLLCSTKCTSFPQGTHLAPSKELLWTLARNRSAVPVARSVHANFTNCNGIFRLARVLANATRQERVNANEIHYSFRRRCRRNSGLVVEKRYAQAQDLIPPTRTKEKGPRIQRPLVKEGNIPLGHRWLLDPDPHNNNVWITLRRRLRNDYAH